MDVATVLASSSASVLSPSSVSSPTFVLNLLGPPLSRVACSGFCEVPVASKKKSPVASLCHQKNLPVSSVIYLDHVPLDFGASGVVDGGGGACEGLEIDDGGRGACEGVGVKDRNGRGT